MINEYFPFRDACAASNIDYLMQTIGRDEKPTDIVAVNAIQESNSIYEISSDEENALSERDLGKRDTNSDKGASVICITVTDSESDDGEANVDWQRDESTAAHLSAKDKTKLPKAPKSTISRIKLPVKCATGYCKETFGTVAAMKYHLSVFHAKGVTKTYQCYICKLTRRDKGKIQIHINGVHSHAKAFKCPFPTCVASYFYANDVNGHLKTHSKTPKSKNPRGFPFKCGRYCRKRFFESVDALKLHVSNYHRRGSKPSFECHLCKMSTTSLVSLEGHIKGMHIRRKWIKCPVSTCSKIFHRRNNLSLHTRRAHSGTSTKGEHSAKGAKAKNVKSGQFSVKCSSNCKNLFENVKAMTFHVQTFHAIGSKNTYQCHMCKKTFYGRAILQRHMDTVHYGLKPFACPARECEMKFGRECHMRIHFARKHAETLIAFSCNMCAKTFKSKEMLKHHMDRVHSSRLRYECPIPRCLQKFPAKYSLKQHVLNEHSLNARRFCCYLCKKTVACRMTLRKHMFIVHIAQRNCACPIPGCSSTYKKKCDLKTHLAYKHGQGVVHKCELCKKILASAQSLRQHMMWHRGEKRFKCPKPGCLMAYSKKFRLEEHMLNAHAEKPIIMCPVCGSLMENRQSLDSHMQLMHTKQWRSLCETDGEQFQKIQS